MNLQELVSEKIKNDIDLGYDVWQRDSWSMALSLYSDYRVDFEKYDVAVIANAVRTWRRENAYINYKNAS